MPALTRTERSWMICWRPTVLLVVTVAKYHGIGKGVTLKVLRTGKLSLSKVGDITVSVEEAVVQATHFILSCYGRPACTSLTDARQKIWSRKVSQSIGAAPKLQSLPPTNEAFAENVARTHLQNGNMPYISSHLT